MLTLRRKDELASICRPSQRPWLQQRRLGRPEDDDNEHDDNVDNNYDDDNADNNHRQFDDHTRSRSLKNADAATRVASADDGDGDDGGDNDDENHRDDDDDDDGDDDGDDDYVGAPRTGRMGVHCAYQAIRLAEPANERTLRLALGDRTSTPLEPSLGWWRVYQRSATPLSLSSPLPGPPPPAPAPPPPPPPPQQWQEHDGTRFESTFQKTNSLVHSLSRSVIRDNARIVLCLLKAIDHEIDVRRPTRRRPSIGRGTDVCLDPNHVQLVELIPAGFGGANAPVCIPTVVVVVVVVVVIIHSLPSSFSKSLPRQTPQNPPYELTATADVRLWLSYKTLLPTPSKVRTVLTQR
ncbi:hypothetical protein V1478_018687 [Vespula squamosa]|uniref:Uncharacterized protein n=1 Tax=Vespula squamosa TaxID=30214 RepID=A0ABD1ZTU2_VESSQ